MKRIVTIFASAAACASAFAADVRVSENISEDTIWTNDNTYFLDAQVYVVDGASLTIEPGTVIKGASLVDAASALIITRGSKIYAMGSPSAPIIFTAESDPLDGSIDESNTALWGGVIILGAAPLNSESRGTEGDFGADPQVPFTDNIEGLENSTENTYSEFGGLDPEDNSGIFRYVSIRHGGSVVGSNNEINGLTMGGVGSGTLIEFVEVFANKDDGFEWFGGTVNARYLVAAFGNDDSFDYDQGWTGKGQFWFTIGKDNVTDAMDHGGEHDGTVDFTQDGLSRGMGTIYNATYIGPGSDSGIDEGVFEINDDAGVRYYNSIFMSWGGHGVDVVDPDGRAGLVDEEDGVTRIDFRNNIWWDIGDGTASDLATAADVVSFLTSPGKGNEIEDPMLRGVSRTADGMLDPRPASGSPANSNAVLAEPADGWYLDVDYQGAFGSANWLYGWTKLSQDGYLPAENGSPAGGTTAISSVLSAPAGGVARSGFVVGGELPQLFIVRAKGPKLVDDGIAQADVMADPQMRLIDRVSNTDIAMVTGWVDMADAADTLGATVGLATLGATEARPTDDTTSAVAIVSLRPGVYSAVVSGEDAGGGAVQVEIYATDL